MPSYLIIIVHKCDGNLIYHKALNTTGFHDFAYTSVAVTFPHNSPLEFYLPILIKNATPPISLRNRAFLEPIVVAINEQNLVTLVSLANLRVCVWLIHFRNGRGKSEYVRIATYRALVPDRRHFALGNEEVVWADCDLCLLRLKLTEYRMRIVWYSRRSSADQRI